MFELLLPCWTLLLALGSFFVGVLGLLLSLYLYKKSRIFKKIDYAKKEFSPTTSNPNVEAVTITFLAIWNSGNGTIYPSDILETAPLSVFTTGDSEILNKKIVYVSNKLNGFKINIKKTIKNRFRILFNYVGKKEGVILKIIHTGAFSDSIAASCHIKDGEKPSLTKFIDRWAMYFYEEKSVGFRALLSLIFGLMLNVIFYSFVDLVFDSLLFLVVIFFLTNLLFAIVIFIFLTIIAHKLALTSWPPLKNFDVHEEIDSLIYAERK